MNAYYGTGNLSAVGAAQVFAAAGRDDIVVSGIDDAPEVLEGIRNGRINLTYAQQPYGQGYLLIYVPWLMKHKGLQPTVKFVDSGITFIDKSNVDTYHKTMEQNFVKLKAYIETEAMK
jgi:ribose transport system substrate-binding protein